MGVTIRAKRHQKCDVKMDRNIKRIVKGELDIDDLTDTELKMELDDMSMEDIVKLSERGDLPIIVDSREGRSNIPNHLDNLDVDYIMTMLDVGDYIVMGRVIERKSSTDFVQSILDSSMDKQDYELSKNLKFYYIAFIGGVAVALRDAHYRNFSAPPRDVYWSKFASLIAKRAPIGKEGIELPLQFETSYDFALFLKKFDKKLREAEIEGVPRLPKISKVKWSVSNKQVRILSSIPQIGKKRGRSLLKHFESVRNIANASKEDLEEVYGIGESYSEKIYNLFNQTFKTNSGEE